MLTRLLSLFTCRHRNYGRAFTDDQGRMYVVCSDCCQRVPYDWEFSQRYGPLIHGARLTGQEIEESVAHSAL